MLLHPGSGSSWRDYVTLAAGPCNIWMTLGDRRESGGSGLTAPSHTHLAQRSPAPGVPFVAAEGGGVERDCGLTAPINIVFIQVCLEPMDNPLGDRWREGRRG